MGTAVETWQGRQHNPEFFSSDGVIGDSTETLNDVSLDVDFYRFQLDIGERVTSTSTRQQVDARFVHPPVRCHGQAGCLQRQRRGAG